MSLLLNIVINMCETLILIDMFITNFRDIEKIKNGIAEKASHFLNTLLTAIVCIVVSFFYGWQLTLIVISYLPIVCLMNFFIAKVIFS